MGIAELGITSSHRGFDKRNLQTKHIQSFTEIAVKFSVIKKGGVSIFYRKFVARMRAGTGFKKLGRQGEVLTSKSRTDWNWP